MPFLVSGDFNAVMHVDERRGIRKPENREMDGSIQPCAILGLQDIAATGCTFTWTNGHVFSKIDRAMVNRDWHDAGYLANTTFLHSDFQTDHSPVVTKIFADVRTYPKPLKFFNFWMDHPEFDRTMKENWRINVVGSKKYTLFQRGKAFKQVLKAFNFKEFSDISARAKEATKKLEDLQMLADQDTDNRLLQDQIKILKKKAELLVTSEKNYYSQKAGLKHMFLSDRNTNFFHAMVRSNNTRNTISFLCKPDGSFMEDQDGIIDSFVHFYKGLLGAPKQTVPLVLETISNGYVLGEEE